MQIAFDILGNRAKFSLKELAKADFICFKGRLC